MKVFILCGGYGTRLDYEGQLKAKPMVRIGNAPILMHLIKLYCLQGVNEFVFCLGYKANTIQDYFLKENKKKIKIIFKKKNICKFSYKSKYLNFIGNLIFTGIKTGTGGRLKRAYNCLKLDEDILMTYGDGLSNVNVSNLVKFHKSHKKLATVTAVKPLGRYGAIEIDNQSNVKKFSEKPKGDVGWINGGYFVLNPKCIDLIEEDATFWEREPLNNLVKENQLMAFKHEGFWHAVDTMRDKITLEDAFIKSGKYPWT